MRYVVLLGRILYVSIFIIGALGHFSKESLDYAISQGIPKASILVPLSGAIALIGGISILIGFKARFGAWLLVIFLLPVTFMMHNFWAIADVNAAYVQQVMFFKNLSLLGATLLITYFGSGPLSLDKE